MSTLVSGYNPATGNVINLKVDENGVLATSGSSGGGGSGDASAANQTLQLAQETSINTALGTVTASPTANTLLARVKDLLTGIVLAAGTNLIGKVGIDQTTPGTTNAVVNKGQTLTNATTTAYAASLVAKDSAGTLFGLTGYNSSYNPLFIQIHDASALPADTAIPKIILYVQGNNSFSLDFGANGRAFTTGIVICNSTTGPTKTIDSATLWLDAQVI